jgi:16S rRNA (guanine527-N7)-methyltransferase
MNDKREQEVKNILVKQLNFSLSSIVLLENFVKSLLDYNKKYNLIAKSTEDDVWHRHILDSAQLVKFIDFKKPYSLSDMGSGAGFPGLVLAFFNNNPEFHVKLYEKSIVKANFLNEEAKKAGKTVEVLEGSYLNHQINSEYIVARAFKKIEHLLTISREINKKTHKMIVLKGKSAQEDINNASKKVDFHYKLENSITNKDSKIIIIDAKK